MTAFTLLGENQARIKTDRHQFLKRTQEAEPTGYTAGLLTWKDSGKGRGVDDTETQKDRTYELLFLGVHRTTILRLGIEVGCHQRHQPSKNTKRYKSFI